MSPVRTFRPIRITRRTGETVFTISLAPRRATHPRITLPNQLLGHFLDHFLKACGMTMEMAGAAWPGSWRFDHVLCEDVGQLIGSGIAAIHDRFAAQLGVPGRATASVCMDEVLVDCAISFEGRPRCDWTIPSNTRVNGLVDAWYDGAGRLAGWSAGTNLRQFFNGFAVGSRGTLALTVRKAGNLHHLYEAAFRALGDATAGALGIPSSESRLAGDIGGFAGAAEYIIEE